MILKTSQVGKIDFLQFCGCLVLNSGKLELILAAAIDMWLVKRKSELEATADKRW